MKRARKFSSDGGKGHKARIALDDQPFSVVQDVGFRTLIGHVEPHYAPPPLCLADGIPQTCAYLNFDDVATHVRELIARDISAFSFRQMELRRQPHQYAESV